MTIAREDRAGQLEFVLRIDGRRCGFVAYALAPGVLRIDHVEVEPSLRGGGYGRQLVEAAVAYARDESLRVVPVCGYARAVIRRDPRLAALLA